MTITATGPVTIKGASGFTDRIFHILGGTVNISGVTISNGNGSYGGAIYNTGNLTLSRPNGELLTPAWSTGAPSRASPTTSR